jgi:hypothetical protein
MLRRALLILLFAAPILIVGFGVLMAASALAGATGDATAGRVLFWLAMSNLMLLAGDLVLLVLVLGVLTLDRPRNDERIGDE